MGIKNKRCLKCNSTHTGVIRYGEPCIEYPIDQNVRFGGCCFSYESPTCFCHECGYEWNEKVMKK